MFTWFKAHYSNPRLDAVIWKSYKRGKKRDISRAPWISSQSVESIVGFERETGEKTK